MSEVVPKFVFDTNIVLDWLVFDSVNMAGLEPALREQRLALISHRPALDELCRVLAYPQCRLEATEQADVLRKYESSVSLATLPAGFALDNLLLPLHFPRCKDGDDQHFLALAYHARVDGLVTKDKLILKLRKRARKFGVTILDPPQFLEQLTFHTAP